MSAAFDQRSRGWTPEAFKAFWAKPDPAQLAHVRTSPDHVCDLFRRLDHHVGDR